VPVLRTYAMYMDLRYRFGCLIRQLAANGYVSIRADYDGITNEHVSRLPRLGTSWSSAPGKMLFQRIAYYRLDAIFHVTSTCCGC
jgi:hypothetical protein